MAHEKKVTFSKIIADTAWVANGLLTKDECRHFIDRAVEACIHETPSAGDVRHRDSRTVAVVDAEMARRVYERIQSHLPSEVWVDRNTDNLGLNCSKDALYGRWTPYGLNSRWRVVCYPGRGHFAPHRDGCHIEDEHHRSLITINGYLTDRPHGYGGATRFLKDDIEVKLGPDGKFAAPEGSVEHSVEADKAGKAVVFFHDLMHDGEPLKEGSPPKWMFRTEVMYERDPSTAPTMTPRQKEARVLMQEAEEAESAGDISGAIKLYSRAYRLDPALDSGVDCQGNLAV